MALRMAWRVSWTYQRERKNEDFWDKESATAFVTRLSELKAQKISTKKIQKIDRWS